MIKPRAYKGKNVAVMGLGKSGLTAAQALIAAGADVRAWDDDAGKRHAATEAGIPILPLTNGAWNNVASLILSPGIPHTYPSPHPAAAGARAHNVEIISDVELLAREQTEATYIGVTGTNGKSTTTALIGHILTTAGKKTETGGNLGYPALTLEALSAGQFYVLEMSSYQLELSDRLTFDCAVMLNVSADHLERHGGYTGYVAAKRRIFAGMNETQVAIIGVDDEDSRSIFADMKNQNGPRCIAVSGNHQVRGGVYVVDGVLYDDMEGGETEVVSLSGIVSLPGTHNAQNAAAAYAAARCQNIPVERIVEGIKTYPGLPHRQQLVAIIDGVHFVNDSKATNPDATVRALACYDTIYWIAGGLAKEGGYATLEPYLPRIERAFLIGDAAAAMQSALSQHLTIEMCGTLNCAVGAAYKKSHGVKNATVLLSPACASFDQFPNFEARGDLFSELVAALPGRQKDVRYDGGAA